MIVADASAAVSALLNAGAARQAIGSEQVHVPHLVDTEIASSIRRLVSRGELPADDGWQVLDTWQRLATVRHSSTGLLERIWQLRRNASVHDATYVALAEALGCALVTADGRLSRVAGLRCAVTVVPR